MSVDEIDAVDSVALFGQRRWRSRLVAWRRWLVLVLAFGLVAFTGWVVLFSTWLGLRQVDVQGVHRVSAAEVQRVVAVAQGTPLARVDLNAVEARVESIPAVATASVHRGWPHSLVVDVTERQPVAVVHRQGSWWLMDRTGALFGASTSRDPAEPIAQVDGGAGSRTLREVAGVLGELPADLATATKRVSASSPDSITVQLADGSQVRWGNASESGVKAAVLRALREHHKAAFYDVSVPSQPATRG
jgi:cell division protein FtsQ